MKKWRDDSCNAKKQITSSNEIILQRLKRTTSTHRTFCCSNVLECITHIVVYDATRSFKQNKQTIQFLWNHRNVDKLRKFQNLSYESATAFETSTSCITFQRTFEKVLENPSTVCSFYSRTLSKTAKLYKYRAAFVWVSIENKQAK